ncbi:uncharacterized protein [Macaca nemestrina]|uniref:uncharacterized protein n=1 Tax=Macaca nemestrina TaxID=9545 RepID=UPI0039B8AD04
MGIRAPQRCLTKKDSSSPLQASHPLKGTSLLCLCCGRQGAAPTAARPVRQRGPGWSSPGPQPRGDDRRQIPSLPPHSSPCLSLIPLPSHAPACSSQVTASRNRQYSPKSPAKDTEGWTGEKTSPSPHDSHPQPCTTAASGTSSTQASAPCQPFPSPPGPCVAQTLYRISQPSSTDHTLSRSLSPLPRITHSADLSALFHGSHTQARPGWGNWKCKGNKPLRTSQPQVPPCSREPTAQTRGCAGRLPSLFRASCQGWRRPARPPHPACRTGPPTPPAGQAPQNGTGRGGLLLGSREPQSPGPLAHKHLLGCGRLMSLLPHMQEGPRLEHLPQRAPWGGCGGPFRSSP